MEKQIKKVYFDPATASKEIKEQYINYLATTFNFRDSDIQEKFKEELNETVAKGPFVEIKDVFEKSETMSDLIKDGILSHKFYDLESASDSDKRLPLKRQLYRHQSEAIRKIVDGKNVVIATGTGSGKTNCFVIPVINELLREEERGELEDGVRAIFIYPMNALANDQIDNFRRMLADYTQISFGIYNGATEYDKEAAEYKYESAHKSDKNPKLRKRLENERLSREEIKERPPHILFTNYSMLEYLLLRPGDDVLFANSQLKFVVLDEAHVYNGALGIETALLMGRLKARLGDAKPQFIMTSATLGDQSEDCKRQVAEFAGSLTGCAFDRDSIVYGSRKRGDYVGKEVLPEQLFIDLASANKPIKVVLQEHGIEVNENIDDNANLYELIKKSALYKDMRSLGELVSLDEFPSQLGISKDAAIAFVAMCSKAKKNGEALVDIRYHYFLRAIDGAYMALDYPQSFSLTRQKQYENIRMFEVGVCERCGEIVIVGSIKGDKLEQFDNDTDQGIQYFQIVQGNEEEWDDDGENTERPSGKKPDEYFLCKNCGAIVPVNQEHNEWCKCGNKKVVKVRSLVIKNNNYKCIACNDNVRRLSPSDAATRVVATSLFEQLPRYELPDFAEGESTYNPITKRASYGKPKAKTRQFLIFSDSRQGAAKFACDLTAEYEDFLRRRALWHVANVLEGEDLSIVGLVKKLKNTFETEEIFKKRDSSSAENAWIAVLNELANSSRRTSLVSLGKLQFYYLGNTEDVIAWTIEEGKKHGVTVDEKSARALLDYLAVERIATKGAIKGEEGSDIGSDARKYVFYSEYPKYICEYKKDQRLNFLPASKENKKVKDKDATEKEPEKRKRFEPMNIIKDFLHFTDKEAKNFLDEYWKFVLTDEDNEYRLEGDDGNGYYMPAGNIGVKLGKHAKVWKCEKCNRTTQFNIGGKCRIGNCGGTLVRLDSEKECRENHYAALYSNEDFSTLLVKEHTAQLDKTTASEYQQQFVEKEINALSCSTTFEMGVDVGTLETVYLRGFPPLPSNYAQRVGRAGRSLDAAAFALTYAKLNSHDLYFFNNPEKMIKGVISPPQFCLQNEKIAKRHIYAVALSVWLKEHEEVYSGNNIRLFIDEKRYADFLQWLRSEPQELKELLKRSIPQELQCVPGVELDSFGWLEDFCGEDGRFMNLVRDYEQNVRHLEELSNKSDEYKKKLSSYKKKELIKFLVSGNILPKYGFPVDVVQLRQNIASKEKTLDLSRDLSIAIAEYAPSAEVVADGELYTSRYIKKPIINKAEKDFDIAYFATCQKCDEINFRDMPVGEEGTKCAVCGNDLSAWDFRESIEPQAGFIAEEEVRKVPREMPEHKHKTEDIYIGDKNAYPIAEYSYELGNISVKIRSTANDSMVVRSTGTFYVCEECGYTIADDENNKLKSNYRDYKDGSKPMCIKDAKEKHKGSYGKGPCSNTELKRYYLHHEFKTDVAKIDFETDTSDFSTMLSVAYALLNAFAIEMSIERSDIKACLKREDCDLRTSYQIIIYDAVPGGAGHSRRLVTEDGEVLRRVIKRAMENMERCHCDPSCYNCLRSYENQRVHKSLDRKKALEFLQKLV